MTQRRRPIRGVLHIGVRRTKVFPVVSFVPMEAHGHAVGPPVPQRFLWTVDGEIVRVLIRRRTPVVIVHAHEGDALARIRREEVMNKGEHVGRPRAGRLECGGRAASMNETHHGMVVHHDAVARVPLEGARVPTRDHVDVGARSRLGGDERRGVEPHDHVVAVDERTPLPVQHRGTVAYDDDARVGVDVSKAVSTNANAQKHNDAKYHSHHLSHTVSFFP